MGPKHPTLSPRQKALVLLIRKAHRERGASPTQDELAAAMGITSQSVREHLKALERKRMIVREGKRAITLVEANLTRGERVPVYAGVPGVAPEITSVWLDSSLVDVDERTFGFVLGDDAGDDPYLRPGDYVFARPMAVEDGGLHAVVLGERMTVRRVFYEANAMRLEPGGTRVPLTRGPIAGRVVAIHRVFQNNDAAEENK